MRIKIVGRERQDYRLDNGYEFHGVKYHGVILDETDSSLQGCRVTSKLKIADGSPHALRPMEVGQTYKIYFNQKSAIDFIGSDDGAPSSFPVFQDVGKEVHENDE